MKINKNIYHTYINTVLWKPKFQIARGLLFPILILFMGACTDFVEVDPPKNNLISETVFENPETVESALANIYFKMRDQGMLSGRFGFCTIMGIYVDELDYYRTDTNYMEMYQHNVTASNTLTSGWWNHAYNIIYAANDIVKGVDNAKGLTTEVRSDYKGQALFIRAYMHSLLVGVYGDIPYITTTDYLENNRVKRMPQSTVYEQIISDLKHAISLMKPRTASGEHVVPDRAVASALLARVYFYTERWELAALTAGDLIESYNFETDINKVFLKSSLETLWQFKPNGVSDKNTYEANQFIIRFIPGQTYALNNNLLDAFEPNDLRATNWVGSLTSTNGLTTLYFAHKYKALLSNTASLEYSIVFRLTEQYLIRAEARAQLNDILGSQNDLNKIRNRAGLENTLANTQVELLAAIMHERQVEFFTEQGHRWFDLKRLGKLGDVLEPIKTNWSATDVLLPIPEQELEKNPNLKPQNLGY